MREWKNVEIKKVEEPFIYKIIIYSIWWFG